VYDDLGIPCPSLECMVSMLRHQSIGLDAAASRIVARDDQFARILTVGKPQLVTRHKPARMVSGIKLLEAPTW